MFETFTNSAVVPFMKTLKEVNVDYLAYESQVFHFDSQEGFALYFSEELVELRDPYQKEMSEKLASLCAVIDAKPSQIRYAIPAAQLATYTRRALDDLPLVADPTCKLIIVDRTIDMISPLLHEFTYLAMLEDVLDEDIIEDEFRQKYTTAEGVPKERLTFLDERDPVLYQIRHKHIAESIDWLVSNVNSFTRTNELGKGDAQSTDLNGIATMMRQLPKFQELGAKYSIHLDLAQMMIKAFKDRKLDQLATVQQSIATGLDTTGKAFRAGHEFEQLRMLIQDQSVRKEDILRTILLLATNKEFKASQTDELLRMGGFGDDEIKAVNNMRRLIAKEKDQGSHFAGLSKKNRRKQQSDVGFELSRWTPLLKHLIEALSTNKLSEDEYPKMNLNEGEGTGRRPQWARASTDAMAAKATPKASSRIIVFVVGGITYSEIRAIHELMDTNRRTEIILGSTHIIKPNEFSVDMGF
jgi:syntaxin-binding protein 1